MNTVQERLSLFIVRTVWNT